MDIMEKWELDEADVSINIMLHADVPALISQLHYHIQVIALYGLFSFPSFGFACISVSFRLFFNKLRAISNPLVKYWTVFVLYELVQVLLLLLMWQWSSESFSLHLINSTVLLVLVEISPIHSVANNCFLLAKHLALWALVAWSKGIPGDTVSLVPAVWVFWNLFYLQDRKRKLLVGKQRAEQEKEVEQNRLRTLLAALPDGVVVFSEKLEILTHNPTILTQLGLQPDANVVSCMETLVGNLNYDPEYLGQGEHSEVFKADLNELLRQEEGAVKNFKPLLYEGKHLECRGCVTKWDESKVLVLTVRDTSNWAQLEKAAKRDSANKTALIRSVSHELRTPVNAIINLCQDLQESGSLVERDRADVEVLANASGFLLFMINDLLDYSRILHDKFELRKTNFDLERLIRSCGQLIALQCKHKQVDFTVRYDPQLPQYAYSDENRLKQVILNLLSNAAK